MVELISPRASFIQFTANSTEHCIWGTVAFTLPVLNPDDIAFQFFLTGTEEEVDSLMSFSGTGLVRVGLADVDDNNLLEFTGNPSRFRLSDTLMAYNWEGGLQNFDEFITEGTCFRIYVDYADNFFYSNKLERISSNCFSSVVEYAGEDDSFGFNYCADAIPGAIVAPPSTDPGEVDPPPSPDPDPVCEPTVITFTNMSLMIIPYTAQLEAAYGPVPTVQAWIYDETAELVNPGIVIKLDSAPPTQITIDFGGPASGIVIIKQ